MKTQTVRFRLYRLIGEAIREQRRNGGTRLTQQELADSTGGKIRRSTLANIEVGKQQISLYQLYLVAAALGVQPTELLPRRELALGEENDLLTRLSDELSPGARKWAGRVMTKAAQPEIRKEKSTDAESGTD